MLEYLNLAAQHYLRDEGLKVDGEDVSLSCLPLSHVFERVRSFSIMHLGSEKVLYLTNTDWVRKGMDQVHPILMCAVSLFCNKMFARCKRR